MLQGLAGAHSFCIHIESGAEMKGHDVKYYTPKIESHTDAMFKCKSP